MNVVALLQRLHALDQEWDEKARRFQAVRAQLEDTSLLTSLRQADHDRREALAETQRRLRDAELEIEGLRAKARETQEALYGGRVRSPREVESLRQGGEQLKRRIGDLEDEALEMMARVEDLQAAIAEGAGALAAQEAEDRTERQALQGEYATLRRRLQELRDERVETRAGIGRAELALYDELRAQKAGGALAPFRDGYCQVCRVSVPSEKARLAEQGLAAVTCEGCGRILYHA